MRLARAIKASLAAAIFAAVFSCPAATPLESTQANVQFNLALNLYNSGKLDASAETLRKALKVVPEHPQANLLLGLILSQQGDFKGALPPLRRASKSMPGNFDAFNNLGVAAYQAKESDEAEAAFKRASEIKPERADVLLNLGVLELSRKRWKPAQDAFSAAAKLDPKNAKALAGVAEAAEKGGDKEAELEALDRSLKLDPGNKAVRLNLAQKFYRAEKNAEAAAMLAPLKDTGDSEAEFLLGCLFYRQARFDESRERFEAALKARPDYPEARFNLAITLYDQNKFQEALDQFQEVLKRHPGDEQAKSNLEITRRAAVRGYLKGGSQDFLQGDYLAAMEKWRAALQLEGDNKVIKDLVETAQAQLKLRAAELSAKGAEAAKAGKVEDAVASWSSALENDPQNAEALAGLDKLKGEAARLAGIYGEGFKSRLAADDLAGAREQAKRLASVDKAKGAEALKLWQAKAAAKAAELVQAGDAASAKEAWLEAEDKYEAAGKLDPGQASVTLKLNQAKVSLRGELNRALAAAKDAVAAKDAAKALKEYRRVLELEPGNREAQAAAKQQAKAAKAKAPAVDSAELDEWYYQGVYAYAAGDTAKALGIWKKILAVDPGHKLATEAVNRAKKRLKALSEVK